MSASGFLSLLAYVLARIVSTGPLALQAARLYPALPACPRGSVGLHEIKFDGYRVIARKDGEHVRLWARTTSDYSQAFIRIRDAVAGLPIDCVVLDGEAVLLRSDNTSNGHAP
jgi:ATP-dependent DNA ligase